MTTLAERCYIRSQMSSALERFVSGAIPTQIPAVESLFDGILTAARLGVEFSDEELHRIYWVAGDIFIEGNNSIQTKSFNFMKELIDIFNYERSTRLNGGTSAAIAKFTKFYSCVMLRYSKSSALFTRASEQAEELVRETYPHRALALGAFEACRFEAYPIRSYEKKAVKNILKILKQKISCHGNTEPLMPATLRFIEAVCENQNSCGTVILVCGVLEDLLASIVSRQAYFELDMFEGSPVFKWIMRHTDRFIFRKKCWVAIAHFMNVVFRSGNNYVVGALVAEGVFPRIHHMLRDGREILLMELLGAVRAACSNSRLVPRLISEEIFLHILPIVENGNASRSVRSEACKVFSRFLRHASDEEVFWAAEIGIIGAVVKLLKSRNELAVTRALRWMLDMSDRSENIGKGQALRSLVIAAKEDRVLEQLRKHSDDFIRSPA